MAVLMWLDILADMQITGKIYKEITSFRKNILQKLCICTKIENNSYNYVFLYLTSIERGRY